MTTYYRNRETGIIQSHQVSGLGDFFNSDEVGEDAKPILPLGTASKGGRKPNKPRAAKPAAKKAEAPTSPVEIVDGESTIKEGAN